MRHHNTATRNTTSKRTGYIPGIHTRKSGILITDLHILYKALRSAGGFRRALRSLTRNKMRMKWTQEVHDFRCKLTTCKCQALPCSRNTTRMPHACTWYEMYTRYTKKAKKFRKVPRQIIFSSAINYRLRRAER